MRIATLVKAGVLSNKLKRCIGQQGRLLGGSFLCDQSSTYTPAWERWIHTGSRVRPSCYIGQLGCQIGTQEKWYAKDHKSWWASSSAAAATSSSTLAEPPVSSSPQPKVQQPIVYRGPLSDTLRKVKLLSLTSCVLSVITGPAIVFLTSPHLSVILKGGIAATVTLLSASTTAALHWFVGPYVHKMTWIPGSKEIDIQTVTWMATYAKNTISIEDIRPPKSNRPFVSFAVKDRFYFVDPDRIPNKELLRLVTFYNKKK